ncbi:Unknown protein [Striga hermonthica]|uniref:Trafficking protein particle complex subunit 13 n=1 Tax=Striga hermonthica TaxID=68872 RepID=A0A9N7R2H8_STRHE|nr:Unknown protein [Striga hermonthica]
MRLCRPTVHVDTYPLKFDPCDLLFSEDLFDDPTAAASLPRLLSSQSNPSVVDPSDLSYRNRFLLQHPTDSLGLPGLLVLPQSFGAIYLGETFCSYISINNNSSFEVRDVVIKRILLLDTSKSHVESVRVGGRYDFIVEHDVKELGAHTLVCTALYTDGENERKYLPQFFKFVVSNPISIRKKLNLNLVNTTDRVLGPFEVWLSESVSFDERGVMVNGLQTKTLGEVQAYNSLNFKLNFIAVKLGILKISGITIFDTIEKKTYDSLLELEIYVDSE